MIFSEVVEYNIRSRWREALISFALVCRAWRPALDYLYINCGPFNAGGNSPILIRLAKTIEINPDLAKNIRIFDPLRFQLANGESADEVHLLRDSKSNCHHSSKCDDGHEYMCF
jgi:hypothetical protein